MADSITRPALTMPAAEAAALRDACSQAQTVLEYGSGGSTILAAELGAEVWSVESDPTWAQMMRDWLVANPQPGRAHVLHTDIGPTRDWGHPVDESMLKRWPDYALGVWDNPGFHHPDIVLVDGRFRLGCFLTAAYRITRPVTLFFDDYASRAHYHKAAALQPPAQMIGRMARFDLIPHTLTPDRIRTYMKALLQPL